MDSVIDMDSARAIVADAALWPRVRDFLWDFATQVHDSWIEDVKPIENISLLDDIDNTGPRVKSWLLAQLGIEPCFHTFPKDDWSRLLLLGGDEIEQLAKWLGALAYADELRHVTGGTAVRELKTVLHGVYPEVFGFTMYFKGVDFSCRNAGADCGITGEAVVKEGLSILMSTFSDLSETLVSRLKFKLPKSLCDFSSLRTANSKSKNVQSVIAKLLKLKFPEAYSLCC